MMISGLPYCSIALLTVSTTHPASMVLEMLHPTM
jgi:hypothetical protein